MTEERNPSDTLPIDREELDRLVAAARIDPDDDSTKRDCPACGRIPVTPECEVCRGVGYVSIATWRTWLAAHGAATFVVCPRCVGEGTCVEVIGKGVWHSVTCRLCEGHKRVRGNIAAAEERLESSRPKEP